MKKRQVGSIVYLISVLVALVLGSTGTLGYLKWQQSRQAATLEQTTIKTATSELTQMQVNKLNQAYAMINSHYFKKVDQTQLIDGALTGMINALDDPYSQYFTSEEAHSFDDTISSSFEGIGAEIKKENGQVMIVSPIEDSPAKKAGVKANDILLKVDGKSVANLSLTKVTDQIKGKKGTKVTITLKREGKTFDITLKRDTIPVETVKTEISSVDAQIGYLQITSFSEPTFAEFKTGVKKLRQEGAKKLVIDVRGNPGGLMDQALKVTSSFLKNGQTIMQVKEKGQKAVVYKANKSTETGDGGFKVTEPVAVLIDEGSASASEIFAAALSESAGAKLIGTKSYGKGTVQTMSGFNYVAKNDNSEFKITTAKWLTPKGNWIHKKGLTPNIKADYPSYAYTPVLDGKKTYHLGDVSDDVKSVQTFLKALDYSLTKANGYFDQTTQQAILVYQADHQLTQNGQADSVTILSIQKEIQAQLNQDDPALDQAVSSLK